MLTKLQMLLGNLLTGSISADWGGSFWLPRQGATIAQDVDWLWDLVYWVSMLFFVIVVFLMFYLMVRFSSKRVKAPEPSPSHNTPLEVFWSVVPTLIAAVLFWEAYKTYQDMAEPPLNTYDVTVVGQKWNWLFEYPDGCITDKLLVPKGVPVRLSMTSEDVMHSFYVPEFRVKRDVIPGRYTTMWFEPSEEGEYDVFCTEYCGTDHSAMLSTAIVKEFGELQKALDVECDIFKDREPFEVGELLYNRLGCKRCHSLDGAAGIGPTFQGLWGREERFTDGTSLNADENYIMQSIYEPRSQVVEGYDPVMPTYRGRLDDKEVRAIIAFIKTLQ